MGCGKQAPLLPLEGIHLDGGVRHIDSMQFLPPLPVLYLFYGQGTSFSRTVELAPFMSTKNKLRLAMAF